MHFYYKFLGGISNETEIKTIYGRFAIYPSRALQPYMRYVFDISDTGGKQSELTWNLDGDKLPEFMEYQVAHGKYQKYEEVTREDSLIALKDFTKQEIGVIIEEEFENRMTELSQITGSVIKEFSEKREGLHEVPDLAELARKGILYVVGTRCGFDLSAEEQDFSQIVKVTDEDTIYRLGSLICDVSCNVLRAFSKDCRTIENERRIAYGSRTRVQGSGRTSVSGTGDSGREGELGETGQIRTSGDEVSGGERTGEIQESASHGQNDREDVGSGGRSEPDDGAASETVPEEEQTTESKQYDGNVEAERTGEDDGRRDRFGGDSVEIPLSSNEYDEELNMELDEINSLGMKKEAVEYVQASFFDAEYGLIDSSKKSQAEPNEYMQKFQQEMADAKSGKYNYLNPKKASVVPHEYVKTVLLKGTGFIGGRGRVCKIFETEIDAGTRAKRIKAEYGIGGSGWPIDGLGLHGYDTFKGNGIRFQWRDEDGEVEGYVSWRDIEKEISALILTGEYQPEKPRLDEIQSDGMREDDEEQEEELDEFAIPDEPESYASARKSLEEAYAEERELIPEEAALEDRLVTMTEYGAELEAEADYEPTPDPTQKTSGELQFIEPINYAEVIAGMDEDMRTAMEILISECSCYTPFKPFLMDLVATDDLFMPNKLDYLSAVVLHDRQEHKAYANNEYGLVEYTLKPYEIDINYKNKNGERVTATTGYRELYEVLSYMVKVPHYCGEDHLKWYKDMIAGSRVNMAPVYVSFLEKQEEIRTNREATRQRALANGWETADSNIDESADTKSEANQSNQTDEQQKTTDKRRNFHYNLWDLQTGGAKTRYKWNVEAIRLLKQLESEGRLATAEEQKILSLYAGWGGIPQAFDDKNNDWSKEYAELKELLMEDEYAAARATVNNAFYTSPVICSCINQALVNFGFRDGNLLEPSMGIGNFFGSLPTPMQRANLYGVELDDISGRIAGQLYQKAHIKVGGFEQTQYPDNFFDVAVGNVPFGDYKIYDPKYNKYNFRIHDYFLAKALDQVRPGGIVAFITTKGTLDKSNPTIRKYLAERAELIGAIRLPNTAFKDNAGTEVTSDIIFLQKREKKIDIEPDWVHLGYTEDGIAVNSYFVEHPEMILGRMQYDTRIYGQDSRYTVCVNDDPNFNMYEALNKAISNMQAQLTDFERLTEEEEKSEDIIPADPDVRNFSYCFVDGKLYFRENSQMVRREVSATVEERIKALDEIRTVTRHLIDIQTEGCSEEELADVQRLLNERYDKFVDKYGSINSQGNSRAFRDDSDYPLLCSLEEIDEDGNVKKADMFYKQTIKAKVSIDRVETAVEALNVSINEFGTVNLAYMQSIYHPDISDMIKEVSEKTGKTVEEINLSEQLKADFERQKMIKELTAISLRNMKECRHRDSRKKEQKRM